MVKMNGEILGKCVLRHRKYFAMDEYGESKKESKKNGDLEVGFFVFSPKFNLQWTLPKGQSLRL